MKDSSDIPAAESALFVVNKWDSLVSNTHDRPHERQKCLDIISKILRRRWPAFESQQLVTLSARRAAKAQEKGLTREDMAVVCDRINEMLPRGMDNLIRRCIK